MTTTNGLTLDVMAMMELAKRHADEFEQLRTAFIESNGIETASGNGDAPWLPCDRFERALAVGSLILTPIGERGRIVRFDRKSERALIELDHGGTRMLKLDRLELRRGRPRKTSYSLHE